MADKEKKKVPSSPSMSLTTEEMEIYRQAKQLENLSPEHQRVLNAIDQKLIKVEERQKKIEQGISEFKAETASENHAIGEDSSLQQKAAARSKGEVKREEAKARLVASAQGERIQSPAIPLSYERDPLQNNLSTIQPIETRSKTNAEFKNAIQKNRWKKGLGLGVGLGVAKSVFDNEDDDILTATGKTTKMAAGVIGVSYLAELGLDYASSKEFEVASMWTPTTVQDFQKGDVVGKARQVLEDADLERKAKTIGGKLGTSLKVGAAIVGVASILDVGQRMADNKEAKRMKHEQEQELHRKEKQRRKKNKEQGYGYLQQGEILFDLFGERTGHYKMGNAKYQ